MLRDTTTTTTANVTATTAATATYAIVLSAYFFGSFSHFNALLFREGGRGCEYLMGVVVTAKGL